MNKKPSAVLSQPGKLVRVSAKDVSTPEHLRKARENAERLRKMPDSEINYSDIPELTDEQIAELKQVPKRQISVRLDPDVLDWLRKSTPEGGYSTRINAILRAVMLRQATGATDSTPLKKRSL